MRAQGHVFKYGDNVDTDVIIPARYLNSFDAKELASHAMADIDPEFAKKSAGGRSDRGKEEFRLWFFQRACASLSENSRSKLCDRRDLCKDFLPQCHQYRASDH